ncbi:AraC family transcriptional regulator ligand-binding domain-containing protein [Parahaliea maris]|nr:AraC family transcriptional regulator ligand-binding domain-containing protein [Parahaliea maris]
MARNLEISTAYARLILRSEWLTPAAALAGTRVTAIDLEREDFIPWETLALMFNNLERAQPGRAWAPALGALFNISSHGPLGFAALSAPTLGAALAVLGNLYPARNSAMRIEEGEAERRYFLFLDDLTGDAVFGERMAQVVMRIAESLLATILGHPVGHNVEVRFTGPPPPRPGKLYGDLPGTGHLRRPPRVHFPAGHLVCTALPPAR